MKVNPDFVLRQIYGKYILMPVRVNNASNDPVLLNNVAADIWQIAVQDKSFDSIVAAVSEKYDLQKDSMEEVSVKRFINLLVEQELLLEEGM